MDIIQDYAVNAYHLYNSADPYLKPIRRFVYDVQANCFPILLPYLNKAARLAQESPAIITVGVFLLLVIVAVQILNFMRRIMMFWTRLVMKFMFWGGIAVLISVIVQRGLERSVSDILRRGRELSDVWWREYRRWEGYQTQNQYRAR